MVLSDAWPGHPRSARPDLGVLVAVTVLVLLVGLAWWRLERELQREVRALARDDLEGRVGGVEIALEAWAERQRAVASSWTTDPRIRAGSADLLPASDARPATLRDHPAQAELRRILLPVLRAHEFRGYFLIGPDGTSLASSRDVNLGVPNLVVERHPEVFERVLAGEARLSPPQPSDVPLPGAVDAGAPTMFVLAPLRGEDGRVVGVFSFRIDVFQQLLPIVESRSWGTAGEALLFDQEGRLLSRSRHHERLRELGLLEPGWFAGRLAVPGVDLRVERPRTDAGRPLSKVVGLASTLGDGSDVDGYPSHMGYPVIGAWRWLDSLDIGVVVERPAASLRAERPLQTTMTVIVPTLLVVLSAFAGVVGWSARRASQAARIQVERERLSAVVDQAADAIVGVDEGERIVLFNAQAERQFGCTRDEAFGWVLEDLIPDVGRVMGVAEPPVHHLDGRRTDGATFPVALTLADTRFADGSRLRVAVVRDRTEELHLEYLERTNEQLEQFSSLAAHDLQSPLRRLGLLCEMLEDELADALEPEVRGIVEGIGESARRMRALVGDLLDVARVRHQQDRSRPVDLAPLVRSVAAHVDATVEVGALPTITGNTVELERLFANLLGNAVKYRRPDVEPRIVVSALAHDGPGYLLQVEDNGVGFEPDQAEQIFEPFRRLRTDDRVPGTGIGLALCRSIVEAHGGTIRAESDGGPGARFLVQLPEPELSS